MKYTHTITDISEENQYPKLVRDKIPLLIKKNNEVDAKTSSVKNTSEHLKYLKKKIVEEASELREAGDKQHLTEEIVDVLEVIDSICAIADIDKKDVTDVQNQKRQKNGGFLEGIVLDEKP